MCDWRFGEYNDIIFAGLDMGIEGFGRESLQ